MFTELKKCLSKRMINNERQHQIKPMLIHTPLHNLNLKTKLIHSHKDSAKALSLF